MTCDENQATYKYYILREVDVLFIKTYGYKHHWTCSSQYLEYPDTAVCTQLYLSSYPEYDIQLYTKFSTIVRPYQCSSVNLLQGRHTTNGYLRRRIAVTLSVFNFSRWFLAEIVENRRGRLSKPFLSPEDNFRKVMTKTRSGRSGPGVRTRRAGGFKSLSPRARAGSNPWSVCAACALPLRPDLVFVITFRKIIPRTSKWSRKTRPAILHNLP
jgi:hypothetical protein